MANITIGPINGAAYVQAYNIFVSAIKFNTDVVLSSMQVNITPDTNHPLWYSATVYASDGTLLYSAADDYIAAGTYSTPNWKTVTLSPTLTLTAATLYYIGFRVHGDEQAGSGSCVRYNATGTQGDTYSSGGFTATLMPDSGQNLRNSFSGNYNSSFATLSSTLNTLDMVMTVAAPNQPPNAPTMTYPTGTVASPTKTTSTTPTITWTFSDPDAGDTQGAYEVFITNNGTGATTWDSGKVLSSSGSVVCGATLTSGTTYRVKVKTWDNSDAAGLYCSETYLYVNTAPNAPVMTWPTGATGSPTFTADTTPDFTHTFSDPDSGDTQSAKQVIVTDDAAGTTAWDSGKVASASGTTTCGATLTAGKKYKIKIRTWDALDVVGAYCTETYFYISVAPNAPTLTWPTGTAGTPSDTNTVNPTITHTFSDSDAGDSQTAKQVIITDNGTGTVAWDSGKQTGSIGETWCGFALSLNTTYRVKVRTWDSTDLVGPYCTEAYLKTPAEVTTEYNSNHVYVPTWYPVQSFPQVNSQLIRVLAAFRKGISSIHVADNGLGAENISAIVDDRDTNIAYTGTGWSNYEANWGFVRGTGRLSKTAGDFLTYTFGSGYIGIVAVKGADCGKINIYIDGTLTSDSPVDLYNGTGTIYGTGVWSTTLQNGTHTIKVEVDATKNASSSDYNFYFDGFHVKRLMGLEHLEHIRTKSNYTLTTNGNGYATSTLAPIVGYNFFAITGVELVTPSPDTGSNKPPICWGGNTVTVYDGPLSDSVVVTVTAIMLKNR